MLHVTASDWSVRPERELSLHAFNAVYWCYEADAVMDAMEAEIYRLMALVEALANIKPDKEG